jgi:hypothetical protein
MRVRTIHPAKVMWPNGTVLGLVLLLSLLSPLPLPLLSPLTNPRFDRVKHLFSLFNSFGGHSRLLRHLRPWHADHLPHGLLLVIYFSYSKYLLFYLLFTMLHTWPGYSNPQRGLLTIPQRQIGSHVNSIHENLINKYPF